MEENALINGLARPLILANHYGNAREGESFVTDHIFSYIISGTHETWSGNETYRFKPGDYRFFKRNQLAKSVKKPGEQDFRSIAVHIDQGTLKDMAPGYSTGRRAAGVVKDILLLPPDAALECYVASLSPYLEGAGKLHEDIIACKTRELVLLLLQTNPFLGPVLFDFDAPGKIDLVAFMQTHYRYNVGLDRMAFLTGRSLSTFKRDFKRTFNVTAGRWLTQKRLDEAHYLIAQQGKKAAEIYLDLGFEDLSHFSFAYKKAFGKAPSKT